MIEGHISLITESDSKKIGHCSVDSRKVTTIKNNIVAFLDNNVDSWWRLDVMVP